MKEKILQKFGEVFGDTTGARTYFAPGRVNLIGEHTDYNGGQPMAWQGREPTGSCVFIL